MVMIDRQGELVGIEGTVEELTENAATLYATILKHVIEEGETRKEGTAARALIEALTEAMLRTVMDEIEDEEGTESIINACKTIGETGVLDMKRYKAMKAEGVMS